MSQETPGLQLSMIAGEDLSGDVSAVLSKRHRAVKLIVGRPRIIEQVDAESDVMLGVLQNLPDEGELAQVSCNGTCLARAAGVIICNTYVKLNEDGKFVQGGGVGDVNWGIALEPTTADGDIFELYLLATPVVTDVS